MLQQVGKCALGITTCIRALKGMQLGREGLRGREIIIEPFKRSTFVQKVKKINKIHFRDLIRIGTNDSLTNICKNPEVQSQLTTFYEEVNDRDRRAAIWHV
ncbi:hypothetical protein DPMN_009095 [Dreissena polymorpha]|uniref:Uncharacterized protein n=1 Tax=Dreissena polymorpha TaxID=45954 RepID=A0A9D4RXN8_DREPO|nr:hypothetical protein DPMN_009095 [Dreissena polymorpha]